MEPAASVIIPTFNRRAMTREAIASVLAQRGAEFELIVVDDGSTDGTWDELREIAARANDRAGHEMVRAARTENRGVAAARNTGVALARAELVAFLDSDDLWNPEKLALQIGHMRANPRCAIAQCEEIWIRGGRRVNPAARHRKTAGELFERSLRVCLISPSAAILRRAVFAAAGGFDEDLRAAEDYDLWLRILVNHEAGLIERPLTTRRAGHPGQLSATVAAIDRFRILALLKLLARDDLAGARRAAVCGALEGKCAVYARGLQRRGRSGAAEFIDGIGRAARGPWLAAPAPGIAAVIDALRALLRAEPRATPIAAAALP